MSLVFDKGKFKYYNELEQFKYKNNTNNNAYLNKNNLKNNSSKNSHIYSEYESSSSPFRYINNNKKKIFLTTYQNYSNIKNINPTAQNHNKKKINAQKLKYNKSFEGNILNEDNFDFTNDDDYSNRRGNNKINKKFNNSVILNNKQTKNKYNNNKSVTRTINTNRNMKNKKNILNENFIIKKLDEKFKSLENNIIDKKYENDIDHDEMILSTKKKNLNYQNYPDKTNTNTNKIKTPNKITNKNYNLSNIIDDVNINNKVDYNKNDKIENLFFDMFNNKNVIDIDENYLLNSSFENNRNDFNIMYTDNYGETVFNDMLSLEIKLLIEKMLELQKSYHKELNKIIKQYNNNKKIFNLLIDKIKILQKKKYIIKKLQDTKNIKGNIYNFIDVYNHNNQHENSKINKEEFFLWKNIMKNKVNNIHNKENLKELFKKTIFDKYNKISGKINIIENKIILNLMKKYKYNINKKSDRIKPRGSNDNIYDKITASPISQYKNTIKQNKNINNSTINKKKKHKKTTSCCPAQPSKNIYFKNSKLK